MNKEQKIKKLQNLRNLKLVYEMQLEELSKREGTEPIIDKMLEMLYDLMKAINALEEDLK